MHHGKGKNSDSENNIIHCRRVSELKGKSHKIVSGHINGANLEYSFFFSFLAPGACIGGLVSGIFKNLYLQNVCKLNPWLVSHQVIAMAQVAQCSDGSTSTYIPYSLSQILPAYSFLVRYWHKNAGENIINRFIEYLRNYFPKPTVRFRIFFSSAESSHILYIFKQPKNKIDAKTITQREAGSHWLFNTIFFKWIV